MFTWLSAAAFVVGGGLILIAAHRAIDTLIAYFEGKAELRIRCEPVSQAAIERFRQSRAESIRVLEEKEAEPLANTGHETDLARLLQPPQRKPDFIQESEARWIKKLRAEKDLPDYEVGRQLDAQRRKAFRAIFAGRQLLPQRPIWTWTLVLALGGVALVLASLIESWVT